MHRHLWPAHAPHAPRAPHERRRFAGNPYLFLGPRPFREERVRSYIVRQHRLGRPLADILDDGYVRRCGNPTFCWKVLCQPETIAALATDVRDAIREQRVRP